MKNPQRLTAKSAKQALIDGAHDSDYIFDYIQSTGWRSGSDREDENAPPEVFPPSTDQGVNY